MRKLIAVALLIVGLTTSANASSFKSYYDYASGLNSGLQISFSTSMIKAYERSNKTYGSLITRYDHLFGKYSWFQNMKSRYKFQQAEVIKYQALINNKEALVTLVKTETKVTDGVIVTKGDTVVASESSAVVEERTGNTIKEYAVVTKIYSTPVKKQHWQNTQTIKHYSDGSVGSTSDVKTIKIDNTTETETKVEKELIREYAVVIEEDNNNTDTVVVTLTEAEYLARDDVSLYDTQTYKDAVWNMNSRINEWYTTEILSKHYGNHLEVIGAPAAWSRGYTGKDSIIAILDTGIDLDHSEFEGKIKDAKCFTGACKAGHETIQDENRYSHGTHVAGIAAAKLDGNGTTGVAPDADLLIAKTAWNFGMFDFSTADEAIAWSVQNGADVINISANYNFDRTYMNSTTEVTPGIYFANDTRGRNGITYDKYGYAALYSSDIYYKNIVESMKGHEAILVLAAGNQNADYVGQPSKLAFEDGVGDRVMIVGSWDTRTNKMAHGSNRAGTICYDFNNVTNTCNNTNRASDHYLIAPGRYVASTDANGEYRTNSGTSMAAPQVSGAVAIIHQMWPHMKGSNIKKLLLTTADKTINNYDVNVHGQGLLDLDAATLPQGVVGIPTTGRADGNTVSVDGTIAFSGGANISAFNEIMVLDEYDRDYYFNGNNVVQVNDTRTTSAILNTKAGFDTNYYAGYTGGHFLPVAHNTMLSVNENASQYGIATSINKFTIGYITEENSFLGNIADSPLMRVNGSQTTYLGYNNNFDVGNGVNVFGGATVGFTNLNVDKSSLLKDADMMLSNSATIGVKRTINTHSFGFTTSMPVAIVDGDAKFNMPSTVSANGDIGNSEINSSLKSQNREIDFGMFYNVGLTENSTISSFAEMRTNYAGTENDTVELGINYRITF
jgi:subtilisin family serine protease